MWKNKKTDTKTQKTKIQKINAHKKTIKNTKDKN